MSTYEVTLTTVGREPEELSDKQILEAPNELVAAQVTGVQLALQKLEQVTAGVILEILSPGSIARLESDVIRGVLSGRLDITVEEV
ncbi:MAG TPA: hypothetical protein VFK47_15550 [Ktedonobacteraceae bacterium]|nr:hypothetical protein [Ktedonobacteraceae bacterium]